MGAKFELGVLKTFLQPPPLHNRSTNEPTPQYRHKGINSQNPIEGG